MEKVISPVIEELRRYSNETIAALEGQIAEKDKRIKLLEEKIEFLEAMQHIDASDSLKKYPFEMGVADRNNKKEQAHI